MNAFFFKITLIGACLSGPIHAMKRVLLSPKVLTPYNLTDVDYDWQFPQVLKENLPIDPKLIDIIATYALDNYLSKEDAHVARQKVMRDIVDGWNRAKAERTTD